MQTLLFPIPPSLKVQHLFTDNHQNRVLTLIPSTLYMARLQDRHWTLVDRELSPPCINSLNVYQVFKSAADELKKQNKKRKREGRDHDIEPGISESSRHCIFLYFLYLSSLEAQRPRKLSPPVAHTTSHSQPPKAQKSTVSSNALHKVSFFLFCTYLHSSCSLDVHLLFCRH